MSIWSSEIKEIKNLIDTFHGHFPELEKELKPLITSEDSNVVLLYSRRCLEVIVTRLCEIELKRPRKTEPLKGIIDKLNSEDKVPAHIIVSMHSLNSLSTFGTHPKDFEEEQVKPVLNNLATIIKWYIKYADSIANKAISKKEEATAERKELKGSQKKVKNRVIFTVLIIAIIGLILTVYLVIKNSVFSKEIQKSIAVLPFRNDTPEDSAQYFMDGVMEELLNNLQTIKSIRVCGRTSVEKYREQTKTIPEIARELGVNYIIEGSGQKSGKSLRMRIQLLAVEKNKEKHIWANSFEQENIDLKSYFKAQSGFAKDIASELNAALSGQEKMFIEKIPTKNNEAYEAYLKGKFYLQNISQNNLDIAQKHFELAIEKDPVYALAYTGIAYIWLIKQQMGLTIPDDAGPKAMEAIMKATELDSTIAEVHFILASINYLGLWDWKPSESEFRKAITINPNYAEAHGIYAQLLYILGRPEEAIKHSELSFKLDPLNQLVKMWYGFNFLYEKRYDETISIYREAVEMDPNNFPFYTGIAEAYHLEGKYEESLEATKLYYINWYSDLNHVFDQYPKLDYPDVMNLEGDLLVKQSEKKYIIPADIVFLYVMAGNKEKALEWLEKGYELRDPLTPYIGRPFFTSLLLKEPRYQELLRKLNIPYY